MAIKRVLRDERFKNRVKGGKKVQTKQTIPPIFIKLYTYQLLRGLAYVHSLGICHSIKPENLLVDQESGVLKLCDFGCAKYLVPGESNVSSSVLGKAISLRDRLAVQFHPSQLQSKAAQYPVLPIESGETSTVDLPC